MKGKETREVQYQFPINDKIRALRVQLITNEGVNVGVVSRREALDLAQQAGLDLVQIAPDNKDGIPTVKILNYGKIQYEKKKKHAEVKKHQVVIQIKEIKIRPLIAGNDFQTKMKQMVQFLTEGKRVKITLFFKGREVVNQTERGKEIFEKINNFLVDANLAGEIVREEESKIERAWSCIYYLKRKS